MRKQIARRIFKRNIFETRFLYWELLIVGRRGKHHDHDLSMNLTCFSTLQRATLQSFHCRSAERFAKIRKSFVKNRNEIARRWITLSSMRECPETDLLAILSKMSPERNELCQIAFFIDFSRHNNLNLTELLNNSSEVNNNSRNFLCYLRLDICIHTTSFIATWNWRTCCWIKTDTSRSLTSDCVRKT